MGYLDRDDNVWNRREQAELDQARQRNAILQGKYQETASEMDRLRSELALKVVGLGQARILISNLYEKQYRLEEDLERLRRVARDVVDADDDPEAPRARNEAIGALADLLDGVS